MHSILKINGPILSGIKIPKSGDWKITHAGISKIERAVENIFVSLKNGSRAEVDWISFLNKILLALFFNAIIFTKDNRTGYTMFDLNDT
jgi:hypothetical protein